MKTKTKVIKAFLELNKAMTIKDISKTIKADYRITHTAVQRLLGEKILLSRRIGSAHLCHLNPEYHGREVFQAEEERKNDLLHDKNLKQLHKDLLTKLETVLFVLLYVHSRIPGIHLVFISNENNFKKKVNNVLEQVPLQVNAEIVTESEFIQNHHRNQQIVLHNVESYYLLKCKYHKKDGLSRKE